MQRPPGSKVRPPTGWAAATDEFCGAHLPYLTTARGTEAILPVARIMDRTAYGRQQDWEDSPEGWGQELTYG